MTHIEQHKLLIELKEHERKMDRNEQADLQMFVKRDKDDEDLDEISKKRILAIYEKYIINKPKKEVRSPFGDVVKR